MHGSDELVLCHRNELIHQIVRAISLFDVCQTLLDREQLALGAGGEITVRQLVVWKVVVAREFVVDGGSEISQTGLDMSTGVVGDQANEVFVETQPPEVAGAIDRVEPGVSDQGRIADVMNDPSSCQEPEPSGMHRGREGLASPADNLNVLPAIWKVVSQKTPGQRLYGNHPKQGVSR